MSLFCWIALVSWASLVLGQNDTLGLSDGYLNFTTSNFDIALVKDSQTLFSLRPIGESFDFSPSDVMSERAANGNYHVGDITFRWRAIDGDQWTDADTSADRLPVDSLNTTSSTVLASSDLASTLPDDLPLSITRQWSVIDGDLGLSFNITNTGNDSVELGSFGMPIEFNNIFTDRTAEETEATCSLVDPYIGLDAGYLRVTPLQGTGAALVVTPLSNSKFEAWRFLPEDGDNPPYYQSQTFEGLYEWQIYTKAWAENEWVNATPWNEPTSKVLDDGESLIVGLRFSVAPGIRDIEDTITGTGTPLAVGVPGFIIPQDLDAQLSLTSNSTVTSISTEPEGAFTISSANPYTLTPTGSSWGRTRVTIEYANGKTQTVHYFITNPAPETISQLGEFLTTAQWFNDTSDPFHRAPSVISYDRSVDAPVLQDNRVWIAGLSDEAGAGSWLAATMKQSSQPTQEEITKLENFANETLFGTIQVANGSDVYAVRKSVFYYEPDLVPGYTYDPSLDWTYWSAWNLSEAYATDRAYDYVHVTAAYWGLYRAARSYPDAFSVHKWDWYLNQAYETAMYATQGVDTDSQLVGYADVGLMGETVFGHLLSDLKREALTNDAAALEARMKIRAAYWNTEAVPFGSEQAWDSTGQEGVYYWTHYFGFTSTATKTIDSIVGYMPTVAHWGWNGNARRYWDFIYGSKLERYERMIHHYGSGLNALPILIQFRADPTDTYLLRIGYGGMNGPLSNIDQEGFASAAFHSWPDTLAWDAYSGDYGPNFLGLMLGSACYIVNDDANGLSVFGGNVQTTTPGNATTILPRDAVRRRVFVAEIPVYAEIDAGVIASVQYTRGDTSSLTLTIAPALDVTGTSEQLVPSSVILWLEAAPATSNTGNTTGDWTVTDSETGAALDVERLGWVVPLGNTTVTVSVVPK